MKDIKTVTIQGGYYTVVAIQFDLFGSKIIDEKHFATLEEAETYKKKQIMKIFLALSVT